MCNLTQYKSGEEIRIYLQDKAFALTPINGLQSSLILGSGGYCGDGTTIWDVDNNRVMFQVREAIQVVEDKLLNGW